MGPPVCSTVHFRLLLNPPIYISFQVREGVLVARQEQERKEEDQS